MNGLKTAVLLGALSALLVLGGGSVAGENGMYIGLGLAALMNVFSYFFSDKIALSMYSAQPVTPEENPEVYARIAPMVQNLTTRMGTPMPKLWLIPEDSPNAFATGRDPDHASVAFTYGLLRLMNDSEVEGVIAHELGHVLHRDILISSVAATIAAAVTMVARMGFFFGGDRREGENRGGGIFMLIASMVVAPLIQMAISRTREYAADGAAAKYTRTPHGLISALGKLEGWSKRIPMDASPATAHMFIIQPFSGSLGNLFSTHPSTEDRIARLQAGR